MRLGIVRRWDSKRRKETGCFGAMGDLSAGIKRAGFVTAAAFQGGLVIARKKDEFSGTNEGLPPGHAPA